ncbi:unnamed protein product [Enterobius vermicularis]|uniref:G_PROTEIN_RECEP_F1_2 domain-containing protein n=1 Tax=Enterobius vermicularis TaxID=51028 RepID=A0A0N4VIM5_ENTVE|nr:unnamed protein product [Enterobius vermicularis]
MVLNWIDYLNITQSMLLVTNLGHAVCSILLTKLLHVSLVLLGRHLVLLVLGNGIQNFQFRAELAEQFLKPACLDKLLIVATMCLTIDGDDEAKPNIDVLDFLVLWSLLCLVFKHLSQKTIQRLDTITHLEGTKGKQRSTVTDLRIIAVSFTCLLVSVIMLASSIFAFTISPLFATFMFFEVGFANHKSELYY